MTNQRIVTVKSKTFTDSDTTLTQLRDEVRQFADERNWNQYHTPKNLGMSIAIEAAEIMEHFQWYSNEQSVELVNDLNTRNLVADELADVMIYCLLLANQANIDISSAVSTKLKRNKDRYPIGSMPPSVG
jgi:NTP pyrophosphatase (non-canonical NTP hydrolase)